MQVSGIRHVKILQSPYFTLANLLAYRVLKEEVLNFSSRITTTFSSQSDIDKSVLDKLAITV